MGDDRLRSALLDLSTPFRLRAGPRGVEIVPREALSAGDGAAIPALHPGTLGAASFRRDHGLAYAYACGSMAHGISSPALVESAARSGALGFFGSGGLAPAEAEAALAGLQARLPDRPFGFNLLHDPAAPDLEAALVELFLKRGLRLVEASAYADITLPLVRFRVTGIRLNPAGGVEAPNRIIGKVSRVEVARQFFAPPPEALLAELVSRGEITPAQVAMARSIPLAQDLTAEADSGGHTDNRPSFALIPSLLAVRDQAGAAHGFSVPLRVGCAGGIGSPAAACAAFALGADYLLTGSVNQACVESGTSAAVRKLLAEAEQGDVAMAPSAARFEFGGRVQVLKRGSMFPMRANRLMELYRQHEDLASIPPADRQKVERTFFRKSFDETWAETAAWLARAKGPDFAGRVTARERMALVFRWYLGNAARWARDGVPDRVVDYQIWCGPAMGAFNEWTRGTFLADPARRTIRAVTLNLLAGAAYLTRLGFARAQGVEADPSLSRFPPLPEDELERLLGPGNITSPGGPAAPPAKGYRP